MIEHTIQLDLNTRRSRGPVEYRPMVVVGVDGSLEAAEAAQFAAEAADSRGLDLVVVHAYSLPPTAGTPTDRLASSASEAAQGVADDALSQLRVPAGLHVYTQIERNTPEAFLRRLSHRATLLALGQHAFDIADQLVEGSVAAPLAATADCPVVIVPRGWSRAARRARTVAVALDGTNAAEAVLEFAFAEAERHQSPVAALHVVPRGWTAEAMAADARNLAEILAAAKESHPDLAVSLTVVEGDLARAVLEASGGVRLMVMGRAHRAPWGASWRRWLARAVLLEASCPLVVVA
jgi:nucleotide-binding universal stress UspA family protein